MYGKKSEGIFLDVKDDGIYLVIDNTVASKNSEIPENPVKLIESAGIEGLDMSAVIEAFSSGNSLVERKISDKRVLKVKDEKIKIEISKNAMEAKVVFSKADFFGRELTEKEIVSAISEAGIKYGIVENVLKLLLEERTPWKYYTVAVGKEPIPGRNGQLLLHFDMQNKSNKPKILSDGRVDYRETNYIIKAKKFQVLAEKIEPGNGVDGINVKGETVKFTPGKPCARLPKGKNTFISEDDNELIAEIDGQILVENNRVNVIPVLEIPESVDYETGNIDFSGSVYVGKNVANGFTIKASGNVEVRGSVEAAVIESGGNVNLLGGMKGGGKGIIKADGDIFVKFAERATLISNGSIISESIMHSDVKCKQSLTLEGRKGLLVGGKIYVRKSVTAKVIGSTMATATEITVGISPELLDRYKELEVMYKHLKSEYDKEKLIENFKQGDNELRIRSLHSKIRLRVELDKVSKEMNEILPILDSTEGIVRASQIIHAGVKIIVGGALYRVQDEIKACSLRNVDGKATIGSYTEY